MQKLNIHKVIDVEKYFEYKTEILDFISENMISTNESISIAIAIITDQFLLFDYMDFRLLQIFSKFGIVKNEYNFYETFAKMLEENDLLKGNCCEIGAGVYPRVAELVNPIIEKNNSRLTIYDPELSIKRLGTAKLSREKFTYKTNIDDIDTMYGLFPCDATITLVEKAIMENKNLLVGFCGCDHSTKKYPLFVGDCWAENFCMILKEKYGDELKILNWPKETSNELPIMLRKKN